jgi:hypothetical protein
MASITGRARRPDGAAAAGLLVQPEQHPLSEVVRGARDLADITVNRLQREDSSVGVSGLEPDEDASLMLQMKTALSGIAAYSSGSRHSSASSRSPTGAGQKNPLPEKSFASAVAPAASMNER